MRSLTNDWTILVLAGPKSRDVLSAASRGDWSTAAFPWLSVRRAFVGIAPAVVMSVSFSGELAYEIHIPNSQLYAAYLALRAAGGAYGLTPVRFARGGIRCGLRRAIGTGRRI